MFFKQKKIHPTSQNGMLLQIFFTFVMPKEGGAPSLVERRQWGYQIEGQARSGVRCCSHPFALCLSPPRFVTSQSAVATAIVSRMRPLAMAAIAVCFLVQTASAQQCGTLTQAQVCREDCGSCGAAPCCTLEWDFPQTSAQDVANKLIKIGEALGPDLLFKLEGHTPRYEKWAFDIFDDDPMSVQLTHTPEEWAADDYALAENRVDQIAISVYAVTATSSRAVAFSQTKRATVPFQCDVGSNYRGLFMLVSAIGLPAYRERILYGCLAREFGVIPPEAYPGYDPLTAPPLAAVP